MPWTSLMLGYAGGRAKTLSGVVGLAFALAACAPTATVNPHGRIVVVAAENEYGSMARAIGGDRVVVTSLLDNPNVDPHQFEARTATAITLSQAGLVIKNGLGYDSWIDKLMSASPRSGRIVFSVGEYLGSHTGENPHVWYAPAGWVKEAGVITRELKKLDPSHARYFTRRESQWLASLQPLYREIGVVKSLVHGKSVIATEPVYGYMLAALGTPSLDGDFQKAVMVGTDPSPASVALFENSLKSHSAHMLFYNSQVTGPTTANVREIAAQNHVPVVGVTETQPPRRTFAQWQMSQLQEILHYWK